MTDSLDTTLGRAYELIEANRIDEAKQLLAPLLTKHPENADVWWLYAHAVDNPREARQALERVQEIDPTYPEVNELLGAVEEIPKSDQPSSGIRRIRPLQPPPPPPVEGMIDTINGNQDDFENLDGFEDNFKVGNQQRPGRSLLLLILGGVAVVALLALLGYLLFFRPDGGTPNASNTPPPQVAVDMTELSSPAFGVPEVVTEEITAEAQAIVPTETDTAVPILTPTEEATEDASAVTSTEEMTIVETEDADDVVTEAVFTQTEELAANVATAEIEAPEVGVTEESETPTETPEPSTDTPKPPTNTPNPTETPDPVDQVTKLFGDFELYDDAPISSEDGTLLVTVCVRQGDDRSQVLSEGMNVFAENASSLISDDVELAGITLFDCEAEQALRSVAVPVDVLDAFQRGDIDERDFQLAWRPVG